MHDINVIKKRDPKIINLDKMAIPKKAYLLSFFSRHYHKIMKLKCKARRYLSLFSFLVEKNPGPNTTLITMK